MQTPDGRTHSLELIKTTLHLVSLSILHTTYSMSKKIKENLEQAVNLSASEVVKFDVAALNLWLDKH